MVTVITVKEKIQGLIAKSNNTTGNSDTTLTDAVDALVEGYGAGGETVLTELTVTENGVYSNPAIIEPPSLKAGQTLTFKSQIKIEDIPEHILTFTQGWWTVILEPRQGGEIEFRNFSNGSSGFAIQVYKGAYYTYFDEVSTSVFGDGENFPLAAGWYKDEDYTAPVEAPSFTLIMDMVAAMDGYDYLGFARAVFVGNSIPADGWNKVIVDVPVNEPAVLTELIVTENGVYDEPMIAGEVVVAPNETLTFKSEIKAEDIPEHMMYPQGEVMIYGDSDGCELYFRCLPCNGTFGFMLIYQEPMGGAVKQYFDAIVAGQYGDGVSMPSNAGWYNQGEYTTIITPPTINLLEGSGWDDPNLQAMAKAIFEAPSTPADGWNKVTVNVPVGEPCTHVPNMVPNDGSYVENIYFNTGLFGADGDAPPDAMVAELEKIPEDCWISSEELPMGGESSYLLYMMPDGRAGYVVKNGVSNISGGEFIYFICLTSPEFGEGYIEIAPTGEPDYPYVWGYCTIVEQCHHIGRDTLTEIPDGTVKIGTANHLLTNLISTRPFN